MKQLDTKGDNKCFCGLYSGEKPEYPEKAQLCNLATANVSHTTASDGTQAALGRGKNILYLQSQPDNLQSNYHK